MTLGIILGAFFAIVGFLSSLLGILFLIASGERGSRLRAGIIFILSGVILLTVGIRIFRRAMLFSPAGIKKRLLKLARMNHGEISEEAIIGELGNSDDVRLQIQELIAGGTARELTRNNRRFYSFPDFQLELVMKQCPYCGNDYPVRDEIERCPSCGGDLKMHKSRLAHSEDKFSMDEEEDSELS
jgi:hypothetical protein